MTTELVTLLLLCCHGDRSLGNVTADDIIVSSLIYINLTSLVMYLNVWLELTQVKIE